ncbi:DUF4236 domain-containing protein [Roseburia sp. MUC/MUC-530-WT-4D]|uniref:DUF4236 domain-containing protein n=1 Tax=Roseburia porci TaxID=2605790 RepID=A0A6L5YP14_9FIRM|nr:DUF4236 domain-containing protein [Roseburia porci]MST73431.1 DUF4236 domain-containing protein [Roseburia porci]
MGMRFRKSVKIAPGVKLNIGEKSVGVSVGSKYGGFSVNSQTGTRVRASLPGTGLSYSSKVGDSSGRNASGSSAEKGYIVEKKKVSSKGSYKFSYILALIAGIICLIIGIPTLAFGGIFFILFGILFFYLFNKWKKVYSNYDTFAKEQQPEIPSAVEEGTMVYPEQNLRIIQDCVNIVNNTKNPDTFFERYELMEKKIDELVAIQGPKYTGQSPAKLKAQVVSKKQAAIHDMIDRYYTDVSVKASVLKTIKGRRNRFHSFISTLEEYYDQMDDANIKYVGDLYDTVISDLNE